MTKIFFNLTFYCFFIMLTLGMAGVFFLPLVFLSVVIGRRRTLWLLRQLMCLYGNLVIRVLAFPFVRVRFVDREKGVSLKPCIYICNHRASSDAFLIAVLKREIVQVVNRWPFKIPVLGWVAKVAGYLNVRSMPFEEFLKQGQTFLKQGVSIAAFPEGSRSTDAAVHQFHGAIFRIALAAQVPIVPVCISGNEAIPPKGSFVLNSGVIQVHKLPALKWEEYKHFSPFKLKQTVRQILQEELDRQLSA